MGGYLLGSDRGASIGLTPRPAGFPLNSHRSDPDALASAAYAELRAVAGALMAAERAAHTLQPTALLHEAYLRILEAGQGGWRDELHFRRVAALMMRRVLIDHARAAQAQKRACTIETRNWSEVGGTKSREVELLDLEEALERLEERNERHARVVELRFFGGLTLEETGQALEISVDAARSDWRFARAWLERWLDRGKGDVR